MFRSLKEDDATTEKEWSHGARARVNALFSKAWQKDLEFMRHLALASSR
jgi:hypothetical protein